MNPGRMWKNLDWAPLLAALMLVLLGLVTMKSFGQGGDYFFTRQIIWALAGLLAFFISAIFIDWSFLKTNSIFLLMLYLGLVLTLFLLILTGQAVKGASSWLKIGGLTIEPVELLKPVLVLVLAKYFSKRHVEIARFVHLFISFVYAAVPMALVMLQPDLGSAIVLGAIWLGMALVGGIKLRHLIFLFFTGLSAGLAMGTKWSGVFGLIVVWLFEGLGMITALNEYRIKHSYIHVFMLGLKQLSARVLLLGMLPLVVYVASYSQMFLQGKSWSHFIELHQQIINYQTHLEATHYYQSRPLQWFFNLKSVWYYVEFGVGQRADIYALGNSMLFWFGDLAVFASLISVILNLSQRDPLCGFQDLKNKKILKRVQNDTLLFLLISYFTVWLPWVFSPRIMFFYHYTPAVPLLTIILAYWLTKLFGLKPKTKNQKLKRFGLVTQSLSYSVTWLSENSRQEFFVKLIISLIVLNFVVFYPHWTGIATPVWLKDNLYFLQLQLFNWHLSTLKCFKSSYLYIKATFINVAFMIVKTRSII